MDPLGFVDTKSYPDRLAAAQLATGDRDAAVRGVGRIGGTTVSLCVMDFAFMGGSMGSVVGEKVTRAAEDALDERLPLIVVSASGGARMQEGTLALMQLVRTVAAIARLADAGVPYISLMTDPTTGGVFASFSAIGDVNIAEPGALIGFAGSRVAAGTTGDALPDGFQRAEFLFRHGFVDRVVPRAELRAELIAPAALPATRHESVLPGRGGDDRGVATERGTWRLRHRGSSNGRGGVPWLIPSLPCRRGRRDIRRPPGRRRRDPGAGVGAGPAGPERPPAAHPGAAGADGGGRHRAPRRPAVRRRRGPRRRIRDRSAGQRIVFVGHQKGAEVEENIRRNFGMPHPDGYRKAMRLMRLAERLGLPIVTFVDTPGASPDAASEERGQAEAIAQLHRDHDHACGCPS